jgi:hypothetical protein
VESLLSKPRVGAFVANPGLYYEMPLAFYPCACPLHSEASFRALKLCMGHFEKFKNKPFLIAETRKDGNAESYETKRIACFFRVFALPRFRD